MSGTAPSDPAPGGYSIDRGVDPSLLHRNQHGQAQNIIDGSRDTDGGVVDREIGQHIDAGKAKQGLSSRVDDLLDQPGNDSVATERKGLAIQEKGFKIGETANMHHLAKGKQP